MLLYNQVKREQIKQTEKENKTMMKWRKETQAYSGRITIAKMEDGWHTMKMCIVRQIEKNTILKQRSLSQR